MSFSLPNQDYKVRAGYLGQQFWSETINGLSEAAVDIAHGYADVHVTDLGDDVAGASVYLFTESGSYLSRMQTTDSAGNVSFIVPAGAYKFRVDYDGSQYWSDVVNILSDEATTIDMALDLLALDDTLNPHPRRFDGNPPQYKNEPVYLASLLNITGILTNTAIVGATANDVVYYFINDHMGTPHKMVDSQGNVVWAADIMPFGEAAVSAEAVINQFRFAGQYFDSETGLHYNYHRYYDPATGRYLTPDPIGLAGGIHIYNYTGNNPINAADPLGLFDSNLFWEIVKEDVLSGAAGQRAIDAAWAEVGILGGAAELALAYATRGASKGLIALHGAGNYVGSIGRLSNIIYGGKRDWNFTKNAYGTITEELVCDRSIGEVGFHAVDLAIGLGAALRPVKLMERLPLGIEHYYSIPSIAAQSSPIISQDIHGIYQNVNSILDARN